jgi:hypothetical protein
MVFLKKPEVLKLRYIWPPLSAAIKPRLANGI